MSRKNVLTLFAVSLVLALGACDFSPSSPFEGFGDEQSQGATLNGKIRQNGVGAVSQQSALGFSAQRSLASASEALTVTSVNVYDAGVLIGNVNVKEDGSFTIRGLPGSFTLGFVDQNGNEVGTETFEGVKPNQEIDIVVAVEEDGTVTIVEETRTGIDHEGSAGIEIEGTADNVNVESNPVTGSLDVSTYHVLTRNGETSIRKGQRNLTLDDIRGKQVHVRGVFEDEGARIVFAFEIKLQEEEDEKDQTAPICNLDNAQDPAKPNHILICHKGKTKSVSPNAWPGHYGHGDTCGPCSTP